MYRDNARDNDIIICSLQKQVEDLEEILFKLQPNSNPAFSYNEVSKYKQKKKEGKYNA